MKKTKLPCWIGLMFLVFSCPAISQTLVELEEYETRSVVFSGFDMVEHYHSMEGFLVELKWEGGG